MAASLCDKTLTVYHASNALIDQPSYQKCIEHHNDDRHENGKLGLWFSMNPSWIGGFGVNVYSFELNFSYEDVRVVPMKELREWSKAVDFDYFKLRNEFLRSGYSVALVQEITNSIDMGIVLDFSLINNFKLLQSKS